MVIVEFSKPRVKNRQVWDKTNGHCWYCGTRLVKPNPEKHSADQKKRWYTIDHATPRARGGSDSLDNLLPCCNYCNGHKCDMTVEEYRVYLTMRKNDVPYFSKTQLEYLASIDVDILHGLSYTFWAEKQEKK